MMMFMMTINQPLIRTELKASTQKRLRQWYSKIDKISIITNHLYHKFLNYHKKIL
jgi:hypothetical protein